MALTLHYRIMLREITRKLMIKDEEFVVKGGQLPANTINGNDMQTRRNTRQIRHTHTAIAQLLHMKLQRDPDENIPLHCVMPFANNSNHTKKRR